MDRWNTGTRVKQREVDRQKRPVRDKTDRQTASEAWGQMGSETNSHTDKEKLGLQPAQTKAHGLEVKGCRLSR